MPIFAPEQLYSSQGHKRTRALFYETALPTDKPIITLGTHEKEGYFHLRSAFLEMCVEDPTEVNFAEAVFGDYAFWENITKAKWIEPYLNEWRRICDVKRKEMAFKALVSEVKTQGKMKVSAARYLIEEPWKDKRNTKNKQDVNESTDQAKKAWQSDIKRLEDFM